MAAGVAEPVRFETRQVGAFWRAVRAMEDATTRAARACTQAAGGGVEEVSAAMVRLRRSLTEVIDTARAAGLPPDGDGGIDEESERWFTAIHEAAHALVAARLGHRVRFAGATSDTTGLTKTGREASGLEEAVIAVAGQVATRTQLGKEGGAASDYARAEAALDDTGWPIERAEAIAEDILRGHRRELRGLAARIYRHGRENNIH